MEFSGEESSSSSLIYNFSVFVVLQKLIVQALVLLVFFHCFMDRAAFISFLEAAILKKKLLKLHTGS